MFEALGDSHDCHAFYSRNSGRIQINVGTRLRVAIVGQSRKKRKKEKKEGSDYSDFAPQLTPTRLLMTFFFPSRNSRVIYHHRRRRHHHLLSL